MRVAICDDDKVASEVVKQYVKEWSLLHPKPFQLDISSFDSAESFIFNWSPTTTFDVLFLDITMKNMTGIELAKLIRKVGQDIQIVFTTGHQEHILEGYEVDALHYLLKPIQKEEVFTCLERAEKKMGEVVEQNLLISVGKNTQRIPYSNILYIDSHNHYVIVHTKQGDQKYKKNFGLIMEELDPVHFVLIHRSFVVNIAHIVEIERKTLTLIDNTILPISQLKWQEVNRSFLEFHMRK